MKVKKILLIVLIIIAVIIIFALVFIKVWSGFGNKPSKEMQKSYAEKTQYFYDGKFHNVEEHDLVTKVEGRSMLRDMFTSYPDTKPEGEIPVVKPDKLPEADIQDMKVTWFGHSTILLQMQGMNIITDPVLSKYASPVSFTGSKRLADVPIEAEDLPEIDIVLISHDHYDHLDYATIKKIDSKVKAYCVPLGVESRLEGWGVDKDKIHSMAWYDDVDISGLRISSVPAQHYSSRSIDDSGSTWWCGFILKNDYHSFYYTGDTGMGKFFNDVHERYGDIELMMADTGQYDELWPYVHMNPEEALKAAETMNAKYSIPVHWAGFALANHRWYEPADKLTQLAQDNNSSVSIATPRIGETVDYKDIDSYKEKWWEEVK